MAAPSCAVPRRIRSDPAGRGRFSPRKPNATATANTAIAPTGPTSRGGRNRVPKLNLVRLTIPRPVYESPTLRFFNTRFAPLEGRHGE
jgi:hypothetical protein